MEIELFKTSDTPLAAYLMLSGHTLMDIEYHEKRNGNGKRGIYVFEDNDALREDIKLHNRCEVTGNLATYEHIKSTLLNRVMKEL